MTGPRLNSRFRSGLSRRAVIGALGIAGAGAVLGTAACGNDSSSRTSATSTDPTADGAARASATPDVVDLAVRYKRLRSSTAAEDAASELAGVLAELHTALLHQAVSALS